MTEEGERVTVESVTGKAPSTLQAPEAAVYLSTLVGRRVDVAYLRVLAHRHGWRRWQHKGRAWYAVADIELTADRMTGRMSPT